MRKPALNGLPRANCHRSYLFRAAHSKAWVTALSSAGLSFDRSLPMLEILAIIAACSSAGRVVSSPPESTRPCAAPPKNPWRTRRSPWKLRRNHRELSSVGPAAKRPPI